MPLACRQLYDEGILESIAFLGTQITCFTSTEVQILTQQAIIADLPALELSLTSAFEQVLGLLTLLVLKYKY
jgi:hypothetical protein